MRSSCETGSVGGSRTLEEYNARNQLSAVTESGTRVTRTYQGPGQAGLSGVGSRTYGYNALGMSSTTLGSQTDRYYRDEHGRLVMQHNANGRSYLLTDATGSVRGALDSTGALAYSFSYDPYGRSISSQVPTGSTSRFGYAGGMLDPIGLYHFGQRYYDRQQLRWTQPDPLDQPADLGQANRYAYVAGNPVNWTDPSGQCIILSCDDWDAVGDIAGGVGATVAGAAGVGLSAFALGRCAAQAGIEGGGHCFAAIGGQAIASGAVAIDGARRTYRGVRRLAEE